VSDKSDAAKQERYYTVHDSGNDMYLIVDRKHEECIATCVNQCHANTLAGVLNDYEPMRDGLEWYAKPESYVEDGEDWKLAKAIIHERPRRQL